jgi:hypothetical protein
MVMNIRVCAMFRQAAAATLSGVMLCGAAFAQQTSFSTFKTEPVELLSPMTPISSPPVTRETAPHKFWDRNNCLLSGAVGALSAADFLVTRSNLQTGGRELNPITRLFGTGTAGLALNFAGQTAGVVAVSYVFHKTGHHRLERIVSMLNAGGSAAAVSFDLAKR